jgi:transposase
MRTRIDYGQIAAKLDYAALEKKLEQMGQREPPKKRKTAATVLEPLRERLLAMHRNGWRSTHLAEVLRAVGVPVSPARLRECLNRWKGGGDGATTTRRRSRPKRVAANAQPTISATHAEPTDDGQTGLRLTAR